MASVTSAYATTTSYASRATALLASTTGGASTNASATATASADQQAAATVTLSSEAQAAMAEKDFSTVLADTRAKLLALLTDAGRSSPLEGDRLALDLSGLDARELYAMASDSSFSDDEQEAAGLEMQRRFAAALAGPAAIAEVTGNYAGLYKAAADYLDSLGPEEKAGEDWIAGRAAVTTAQKQLQAEPRKLPDAGPDDPVALYLALVEAGKSVEGASIADVAGSARKALDRLYAQAIESGKAPTFNKATTVGAYIDMSGFSSRTLSAIALNTGDQFTGEEVTQAERALRAKSGAALLAGFQNASRSSDPTAFSQNIMSIFSSMSAEERQAAGWSDKFYEAAMQSYVSTSKLLSMFGDATGGGGNNLASLLGK